MFGFGKGVPRIDGTRARQLVADGATLVDVRTPAEYAQSHIEGALNIPHDQVPGRSAELPRDKPLVLYCHSGARSQWAARQLVGQGFEHVYDLGPKGAW